MEAIKPALCVKVVEELQEDPETRLIVKNAIERVSKLEPYFIFPVTLPEILKKFCEKRNVPFKQVLDHGIRGVNISRQQVYERTLFIAIVLWLFSPSVFVVGYRTIEGRKSKVLKPLYNIEDGLRHNLWGLLGCNKERISQQVEDIASYYHSNYQEFKDQVDALLTYIKSEVKEDVVVEEEEKPEMQLFG